ncbi:ParB/RepB/Spo0J family partition protein [Streptomyces lusitanus]|uniref:ParB/RepB/Spo0J family partition protein n=1 Tax=Streptomyces lusitanus TaxID=68232 RepID=UPI003629A926
MSDLAGSLKTHGQKQAITVMNRDAYIQANPSRETDLEPDTTHVVIDGSSRLAAAREAGLTTVKVMVSDDQGSTSEELLESALVANIHRQDLEELDEARALQRLLAIHGTQRALAKRLHRSQGWVSQRLALLNLTPELQARIGEEPIDLLRAVGNRPHDEQAAALENLKAERAHKEALREAKTPRRPEQGKNGDSDYGVITGGSASAPSNEAETHRPSGEAVPEPRTSSPVPSPPGRTADEPRVPNDVAAEADQTARPQLKKFPYGDGESAAHYLINRMPPDEFNKMLDLLIQHRDSQATTAY